MSSEITIKFKSVDDADKVDLTRIGIVSGATEGLGEANHSVRIEPDIDGWDGVRPEVAIEILRSGFAACGIWVDISDPNGTACTCDACGNKHARYPET